MHTLPFVTCGKYATTDSFFLSYWIIMDYLMIFYEYVAQ